jgi:ATP-dependent Clp protease ATP-binding subunit ClpA
MQLAADDAARQGQSSVTTENLLVGVLRVSAGVFAQFLMGTGTDMPKLRAMLGARLLPDCDPLAGEELPRDADAEAAVQTAIAEADARRREGVSPLHLLSGILSKRTALGATLLAEAGASEVRMAELLKGTL